VSNSQKAEYYLYIYIYIYIFLFFFSSWVWGGGEDASQSRSPQVDSPAGECIRGRVCFGVVNKEVKRECCCCLRTV
jgi:hypothetical protein